MSTNISMLALSQAGGGGLNYDLDTFPVVGSSGVLGPGTFYSFQSDYWTSANYGYTSGFGNAYVVKPASGWHTLLNITGKGLLHNVTSPGFAQLGGRVIVKLTVDGTAKDYDFTLQSGWANGSVSRTRFVMGVSAFADSFDSEPSHRIWSGSFNPTSQVMDYSPTLGSSVAPSAKTANNPQNYIASGVPSLPFSSSLNIQVYTSVHNTDNFNNYAGCVYSITP